MKGRGPNTEPCGTPWFNGAGVDQEPPTGDKRDGTETRRIQYQ